MTPESETPIVVKTKDSQAIPIYTLRPVQLPHNEITRVAMEPTSTPVPIAMIPAGVAKGGSSFMAAISIPHTRKPEPVAIPRAARYRRTIGYWIAQTNIPIRTATMGTTGETLKNANNMCIVLGVFCGG